MTAAPLEAASENRPPLMHDPSFWGLNLTQFLGAFNDNLFKQLVMLLCLDQAKKGGNDVQGVAMILFALPFVFISGFAGYLSDRFSKRTIIVLCKMAEVLIVLLGMIGFYSGSLVALLSVLCLMGVHSAFFGPPKYGILPEMLRTEDLPRANGMILMATFLAIIFGLSAAGAAKYKFEDTLWIASIPCVIIALTGLMTSLLIRRTPVAQPNLQFELSSLWLADDTRQLLWRQPAILGVLLMSSVFWFVGGTIYPPAINALSKEQFQFNDLITGYLAASTGVGIAVGCVAAGLMSKNGVRAWIVKLGSWGLVISMLLLAMPGPGWEAAREEAQAAKTKLSNKSTTDEESKNGEPTAKLAAELPKSIAIGDPAYHRGTLLGPYGSVVALIAVGLFAGFYSVPLQVYLQSSAPVEQKGRIIGALNLFNWVGIAGAGAVYSLGRYLLIDLMKLPQATLFGFAAALMLPVALFYRPPETKSES